MKKKMINVLMLALILTSMLSMAFTIRRSLAESGENSILGMDCIGKTGETALQNKAKLDQAGGFDSNWYDIFERKPDAGQDKNLERLNQTLRNGEDRWNFNDTSGWSSFAYVDGNKTRLIVGVNDEKPTGLLELEKIAARHQAEIVNTVLIGGEVRAVVVELLSASVAAFVEEIHVVGLASYVEPNMKIQIQFVPNDPYWSLQWGPQKIEADWAWNTTVGAPSVLVAVIDTGIYYTHPDLATNYVALGYDWVNMDPDPMDDHWHGTHCAGIIAAVLNNGIGIAGLAQVRVMAEKVLDSEGWGYSDWVASGIIHATDCGAHIISMSLGGYGYSELVHEAVKYAYNAGVLVIAAAGNEATSIKLYPAGYDEVVAVAATDQSDNTAWWSNWGDWIELAAPGVDIYSTVPWGYESWSGTSMACPHVSGVAALVWSRYPNKTRDWVRLWLRYTAEDLGDPGFDIYYGYGRINARKAAETAPPAHELIAYEWRTPPYVKPGALGIINATILNFGENNETDITVQFSANGTMVDSTLIGFLSSFHSIEVSLSWNPTIEGLYNVTLYVVPVPGETNVENNVLWKYIYVGVPVKAVVLHSAGNIYGDIITNWQVLNSEWHQFGDTMIYIDYTTLNKEDITYEDIAATEADVLIISCAFNPYAGWEFTDSEIEAIEQYVHEGHGLIATAGTLYYWVPNNNKLAPLFGLNETTMWDATGTDLLHLVNTTHPIFTNVPNPLVFPYVGTALPYDGRWDSNELVGGEYLALGHYKESAMVTYRGLVYVSPWLEVIPPYYHHHLQLLYNAITWSCYQKPEHDLAVSLDAPKFLEPSKSVLLNATVRNHGLNNETDVELQLLINDTLVNTVLIPELLTGTSYTLSHTWTPTVEGTYNITAYAPPVEDETILANNIATKFATVTQPLIHPIEGQYANYTIYYVDPSTSEELFGGLLNFTYLNYVSPYQINVTMWMRDPYNYTQSGWMIVNIFTRMVESGIWAGMWYPGWIETNVTIGSAVNLLWGNATILDNEVIYVGGRPIDCWEIELEQHGWVYTFWYDKASGLWIGMKSASPYEVVYLTLTATNIPLGFMYEHDLAVTLDAPSTLPLDESSILNATIYNTGLSNETNVTLQLIINGTVVDNVTIGELPVSERYTLSYPWTPTHTGLYNVTAYAPPALGEEYIANNIVTKGVGVFFYARLYIPHEWVGGGVPMGWHADDASWRYTLPFDFPFYGIYYRTIYISSNGLITFLGPDTSWGNSVPWLAQKLAIAPAWDDWVTYDPYDIYIWQNSTHVGIRWYVRAHGSSTVANFEAILSVEGIIQFNYKYNDGYVSATIGISNGAGHILAEDLTDLNYINTIMFVPFRVERDVAIISVEPSANEVTARDTVDVVVVVENQGNFTENFTVRAYASFQGNVTETAYISSLNSTRIYLDPSDYIFSADMVSVGYRFNVTVRVADVEDLALWQVKMYYNDDIINVTRWFEPAWDPEYVFYGKTTISPPYYYEHVGPGIGFVIGGACLLPWPPEQEPFYGGGKLCIIEFEILAIPTGGEAYSCVLNINNLDTYLMDSQRMRIPGVVKEDGYYELSPREYVIGAMNITDLAPGEIVTLIFTWNTTDVPPGYYLICAKASRVPYEVDTEDNVFYDGIITVLPAMFHDVAVTEVSVSLNMVYQGWNVSINVTVANFGNATETFIVTVYYDNTVLATESVQDLEPNATLRLCFIWDTTDVPYCHNFTIKAVASMVLGETNTANNEYADGWVKIKIMGDINCDDKVDRVDIAIACEAFGSYTGHPRWNPDADLDQNGISDMQDIGMVLLNFGTC